MLKVVATEMAWEVTEHAMQCFGAIGMTKEMPLRLMAASVRNMRIYNGPSEVHRMVVARKLMGMKTNSLRLVVRSTHTDPGRRAASAPPGPAMTASTWSGLGSDVRNRSTCAAHSAADAAGVAPCVTMSASAFALTAKAVTA